MSDRTLITRVKAVIEQHGGIRPASRALKIDPAYLQRLAAGRKDSPSAAVLRKFGLRRVVRYEVIG